MPFIFIRDQCHSEIDMQLMVGMLWEENFVTAFFSGGNAFQPADFAMSAEI